MTKLHEALRLQEYKYTDIPEIRKPPEGLIASGAYLGVEFEFEGTGHQWSDVLNYHRPLKKWYVPHQDGSLRGIDAVELVFAKPLHAPHAISAIDAVVSTATEQRWQVNRRTGFHVHLNVGNLEESQFANLLRLYALYEAAIFTAAGDGRSGSIFCIPWFRDVQLSQILADLIQGGPNYQYSRNFGKYSALNVRPISSFGSVEFRHLRNTLDRERLHNWVNLILLLHKTAMMENFDQWWAETLLGDYKQRLFGLYDKEKLRPWAVLDYPDFDFEVNRLTKDVAMYLDESYREVAGTRQRREAQVPEAPRLNEVPPEPAMLERIPLLVPWPPMMLRDHRTGRLIHSHNQRIVRLEADPARGPNEYVWVQTRLNTAGERVNTMYRGVSV